MHLHDIQMHVDVDTRTWFPRAQDSLTLHTFGLVGETGEFADEVKKMLRGSQNFEEALPKLQEELTDVFIYVITLANHLDMDLQTWYETMRALVGPCPSWNLALGSV